MTNDMAQIQYGPCIIENCLQVLQKHRRRWQQGAEFCRIQGRDEGGGHGTHGRRDPGTLQPF